jgi:hypothetical protein
VTPDPHDRAQEALEHLQAAGRELVAAARSALDVVEEMIDDPETLGTVASTVGSFGELLREAASRLLPARMADGSATEGPQVERIRVE